MLNSLISIAQSEDIQEITGLNEKQIQIIFFLIFDPDKEHSFIKLRKSLSDFGFSFTDPTLSRNLKVLEEKHLIIWDRAPNLRYDKRSEIKLIVEDIEHRIEMRKQIEKALTQLDKAKKDAQYMNEKEIFEQLVEYSKLQSSASLYLQLLHVNETITEDMFNVGYAWINLFCAFMINIYIEEIKNRGKKSITEILHLYYQT